MSSATHHNWLRRSTAIGVAAATCLAGSALLGASPALAAQRYYAVSGTLNTGGYLVQYSTFRDHNVLGRAGLDVNNNVGPCGQPIRIGLRDLEGDQITASNVYSGTGSGLKYFSVASSGSLNIPINSYALNGRMVECHGAENGWGGNLYL